MSTVAATMLELSCANGDASYSVMTTKKLFLCSKVSIERDFSPRNRALILVDFNSDTHSQFLTIIGQRRNGKPSLVLQDCPVMHKADISVIAAREANIFLVGIPHNSSCVKSPSKRQILATARDAE